MTLGERVKAIRKAANKTQKDFSSDLGVTSNYVYLIESGKEKPSDRTINDICRIFGVNKEWLYNESGEPYAERSKEEEIARFVGEVEIMDDDSVIKQFISLLASMNQEQRDAFEIVGRMILEKRNQ